MRLGCAEMMLATRVAGNVLVGRVFGMCVENSSGGLMTVGARRLLLVICLTASVAAFAKPAHLLYQTGKGIAYPARHPGNARRGLLKLVKAVF